MRAVSTAVIILGVCLLTVFAKDMKNAISEINQEIIELRTANSENNSKNQKPHDICAKKIMALVPQRFGIKNTDLFKNFEQTKQLLAKITKKTSITKTLKREIYLIEQFHNMMKFAATVVTEDVETLSKRRLVGLANMCHQYDKYRTKPEATVVGKEEVDDLKDKMIEAEISLIYERMRDVKEDRARLNKFCNGRLKNITELISETFASENATEAQTEELVRSLDKELEAAETMKNEKKEELFNMPKLYEDLKRKLEMQTYVLDHYKEDVDCYTKLKSAALKVEKPSFGHLLYLFD